MILSVIVVSYNVRKYLDPCLRAAQRALDALAQQGLGSGDLWVVDNASPDDSVAWVREHFPHVQLIASEKNLGFSAGNNLAIRRSTGTWVLLLNPDTIVAEDAFVRILEYVEGRGEQPGHRKLGGLGVPMVDGTGRWLPESKRGLPTPWASFSRLSGLWRLAPRNPNMNRYYMGHIAPDQTAQVEVLSGAFMWMRRTALDEVGLLDEAFFMYGEDIDLSWRLIEGGWENHYFTGTQIIHFKGESTKTGSLTYVRVFHEAMRIFSRKHFGGGQAMWMNVLVSVGIWLRAGMAAGRRVVQKLGWPVFDGAVLAGGVLAAAGLYGAAMQTVAPEGLVSGAALAYAFLWVISVAWAGGYDSPWRRASLVLGAGAGSVAVLLLYALMPETWRFSRAVTLGSAVAAPLYFVLTRQLAHWFKPSRYTWRSGRGERVLLVGDGERAVAACRMLEQAQGPNLMIRQQTTTNFQAADLPKLAREARAQRVLLLAGDLTGAQLVAACAAMGDVRIDVRIVPEFGRCTLGGDDELQREDVFTWGADGIARADRRRAKRAFDVVSSLVMWGFFVPLLLARRSAWLTAAAVVLSGRKTWVGFHRNWPGSERLPDLSPGVLDTLAVSGGEGDPERLDPLYAKDYRWTRDLETLWARLVEIRRPG